MARKDCASISRLQARVATATRLTSVRIAAASVATRVARMTNYDVASPGALTFASVAPTARKQFPAMTYILSASRNRAC